MRYVFGVLILSFLLLGCFGAQSVKATPIAGGIQVAWDPLKTAAGYNIYRSTDASTEGARINSQLISGRSDYIDTSVLDATTYYYTIKWTDASGSEQSLGKASATADVSPPANLRISLADGKSFTSSASVVLALYAEKASTCRFSNDALTWGDWEPYATQKTWTLSSGDGEKSVYYQCRDSIGNAAPSVSLHIMLSTVPPKITLASPANAGQYSNTFEVVFTLSSSQSGAAICTMTLDGTKSQLGHVDVGAVRNTTLSTTTGSHTMAVECTDNGLAGAASAAFTTTDKPAVSVSLGDGSGYTSTISIKMAVNAQGASECRFSNDAVSWGQWSAYSGTAQWSLTAGDGLKTVYAQCRNAAGAVSDTASDSITLDTSPPPYLHISMNNGARWTNSQSVLLGLYAYSASRCRFSNDNANSWTDWEPYKTSKAWTLSAGTGLKSVYYTCQNSLGNDIGVVSAQITYSYSPPVSPTEVSITINSGDSYTSSRNVRLDLRARNAYECALRESNYDWGAWEDYATSRDFTLSSGNGPKTVYYKCRNDYGESTAYSSIYLDQDPPSPPASLDGWTDGSSVYLSWTKSRSSSISRYDLYRSSQSTGLFSKIGSASSTSYTDSRVSSGETYSYYAIAVSSAGQQSGHSNTFSISVGPPSPPPSVTDLGAQVRAESVYLSWSRPYAAQVSDYEIYRSTSGMGLFSYIGATPSTHYSDTSVSSGETYSYYVRVRDSYGQQSENSNVVEATVGGLIGGET